MMASNLRGWRQIQGELLIILVLQKFSLILNTPSLLITLKLLAIFDAREMLCATLLVELWILCGNV
jgi:bacteriorhodopsin